MRGLHDKETCTFECLLLSGVRVQFLFHCKLDNAENLSRNMHIIYPFPFDAYLHHVYKYYREPKNIFSLIYLKGSLVENKS